MGKRSYWIVASLTHKVVIKSDNLLWKWRFYDRVDPGVWPQPGAADWGASSNPELEDWPLNLDSVPPSSRSSSAVTEHTMEFLFIIIFFFFFERSYWKEEKIMMNHRSEGSIDLVLASA